MSFLRLGAAKIGGAVSNLGSQAGKLVMQSLMQEARAAGHSEAEISAQLAVSGFYRRLGFSSVGEPYAEAGIAHIRMRAGLG
jgi:predicted GNAT family N-acyltransferase